MRTSFFTGVAIALLACSPVTAHDSGQHGSDTGHISVSAVGEAQRTPDMATVSAGVVTQGQTAGEAMSANAARMSETFAELKRAGIADKDMQTSQLSLQPRYDYQNRKAPRITGYEARNTVTARTYDLNNVGPMLDALVSAGANNINGITFGVKDTKEAKSEARMEAVKNARAKAQEMAAAAGIRLGKVMSITEGSVRAMPQPMMMRASMDMAESASTPVAAGEQTLSVNVNMVFEINQ